MQTSILIFIIIGFIGGICLSAVAIINLLTFFSNKNVRHVSLINQLFFLITNVTFFVYALGISLVNYDSSLFWNSSPTWIGNLIPLIINTILFILKINENNKKEKTK